MDTILNRLPAVDLTTLDPDAQRRTVAQAIEAHLLGGVTLPTLAQWALRAFHAREVAADEADDADADDADVAADDAVAEALDILMFADDAAFAPPRDELAALARQLRA
jgi:hypothetical protein